MGESPYNRQGYEITVLRIGGKQLRPRPSNTRFAPPLDAKMRAGGKAALRAPSSPMTLRHLGLAVRGTVSHHGLSRDKPYTSRRQEMYVNRVALTSRDASNLSILLLRSRAHEEKKEKVGQKFWAYEHGARAPSEGRKYSHVHTGAQWQRGSNEEDAW